MISLDTKESNSRPLEATQEVLEEALQPRISRKSSTRSLAIRTKREAKKEARKSLDSPVTSEEMIWEPDLEMISEILEVATLEKARSKVMEKNKLYRTTTCSRSQTSSTLT